MWFGVLTLLSALTISAVAIYYSVAGLAAIFAAAVIPIIIMGVSLEVGKLVTAVWLHRNWKRAVWWLRTYLALAVFVLMFITSMGIFGYLSKAHIEQTSAGEASIAKVQQLESEIARNEGIIDRAEEQIKKFETKGQGGDALIQGQIDKEQERIDKAYERVQPLIDEQNKIISEQTKLYSSQLDTLDNDFNQLQAWINEGGKDNIKRVQGLVGTTPDGNWGWRTSNAVDKWRDANRERRDELVKKIENISEDNPTIQSARAEIERLRKGVEDQIAQSNKLINQLREQLGKGTDVDIGSLIEQENNKISSAYGEIEKLNNEKFDLEGEYRKLEAEVGPIKYIAEFIYGQEADRDLLEEAVRWVIIVIIFVFDPLAVLLLIASQYSFVYAREDRGELPPAIPPTTDPRGPNKEDDDGGDLQDPDPDADPDDGTVVPEDDTTDTTEHDQRVEQDEVQDDDNKEVASSEEQDPITTDSDKNINEVPFTDKEEVESIMPLDQWNAMIEEAEKAAEKEKVSVQEALETEPKEQPYKEIDATIKEMKTQGEWPPLEEGRLKPDLTEVIEPQKKRETYLQKNKRGNQILKVKKQ